MSTHFEGLCDLRVMRMVRFGPKSILVIPSSLGELLVLWLGEGVRVVRVLVVRTVLSLLTHVKLGLEAVGEGHAAVVHGLWRARRRRWRARCTTRRALCRNLKVKP